MVSIRGSLAIEFRDLHHDGKQLAAMGGEAVGLVVVTERNQRQGEHHSREYPRRRPIGPLAFEAPRMALDSGRPVVEQSPPGGA
jgi:hypothetical protein